MPPRTAQLRRVPARRRRSALAPSRFLGEAVQSVLRQTVDDLELIVVDDASTDATSALLSAVEDPRLVVLTNDEQAGLASSLNRGLAQAGGRYVARLDADDVALRD